MQRDFQGGICTPNPRDLSTAKSRANPIVTRALIPAHPHVSVQEVPVGHEGPWWHPKSEQTSSLFWTGVIL